MMNKKQKRQALPIQDSGTANSGQWRMPASWNQNRLTAKLGIEYPIIQGPLGGLSSQRLTAAVSNFGGLGSFGAHGLAPDAIKDVIAEIRSLTAKPFAMNLWVSMEDEGARTADENGFNRSLAALVADLADLGAPRPTYKSYSLKRFEDQARVLLDANVPVFSFIFGIPPREILKECRLRLVREYPREPLLAAVHEAAHYGLYDLDRVERMILRGWRATTSY
jgi:NAD(P)H-dependent flavin oxidoreductase YrpB (nitropropane dioxygenase family)